MGKRRPTGTDIFVKFRAFLAGRPQENTRFHPAVGCDFEIGAADEAVACGVRGAVFVGQVRVRIRI